MRKINKQAAVKAIPRAVLRLLPIGALFLPLGTLSFNLGALGGLGSLLGLGGAGGLGESGNTYNLVGIITALNGPDSQMMLNLINTDMMAAARVWIYVTAAGLALAILAMLAGLAFILAEKVKPLLACALVYAVGTLGGIGALAAFTQFSRALAEVWNEIASAALNYGAFVLAAVLLLNLVVCLLQWRSVREAERLTALARQQKKKK